jgi:hypothetical protein
MNEHALRKFCESRHRTLIVIGGTFVAGLVLILPSVDVYYAGRNEKSVLAAELDSARAIAANTQLAGRVQEKLEQLAAMNGRTVDDESLPALRGRLLEMAKETGCTLRRLNVGAVSSRPWLADDDPTVVRADAKTLEAEKGTGFVLEWRPLNISLSGSSGNLRAMLERISASQMLMHTKSLEMYPPSPNRQSLTLDLELWYFTIVRRGQG